MKYSWGKGIMVLVFFIITPGFGFHHNTTPYPFPNLLFFPKMPVNASNPVTIEGVELGRHLFYDPILSMDSTLSCAGCHKQESAFSDGPNTFSKGINGDLMTRNTMPLFNLAWYPALFWDGRATSIEDQAFHPVRAHNEMNLNWKEAERRINQSSFYKKMFQRAFGNQPIDSILIARAIAQFERSLISYNSKFDRIIRGEANFTADELKGFELMNDTRKGGCLHCHSSDGDALGTSMKFSNNGLDAIFSPADYSDKGYGIITGKQTDMGLFKIPSVRNLAFTAPYMHDGRFKTLDEVLDFYSEGVNQSVNVDSKMEFAHRGGAHLTCDEKRQIISFLNTLNDSTFITTPAFSNPFLK